MSPKDPLAPLFDKLSKEMLLLTEGDAPIWLKEKRLVAYATFQNIGLPTSKGETYRYTPLRKKIGPLAYSNKEKTSKLFSHEVSLPSDQQLFSPYHLRLRQGVLVKEREYPFSCYDLNDLPKSYQTYLSLNIEEDGFLAMNQAALQGILIHVPDGMVLNHPILLDHEMDHQTGRLLIATRIIWLIGKGAKVSCIERLGRGCMTSEVLYNRIAVCHLEEKASYTHTLLATDEAPAWYSLAYTHVIQAASSKYDQTTIASSMPFFRHATQVMHCGEKSQSSLRGAALLLGQQYAEHRVHTTAQVPHTQMHTHYKSVLFDRAQVSFAGQIKVAPHAQKTISSQYHRAMLVGPYVTCYAQPQLGIEANDVICQHGATIGRPSLEALHYMRARGLSRKEATKLLLGGFLEDLWKEVKPKALVDYFKQVWEKFLKKTDVSEGH